MAPVAEAKAKLLGTYEFTWQRKKYSGTFTRQEDTTMTFNDFARGAGCPDDSWPAVYPEGVPFANFTASFEEKSYCWLNGIRDNKEEIPYGHPYYALWLWQWNEVEEPIRIMGSKDDDRQDRPSSVVVGKTSLFTTRQTGSYYACCMTIDGVPKTTTVVEPVPEATQTFLGTYEITWQRKKYNATFTRQGDTAVNFTEFVNGDGCPQDAWPAVYPEEVALNYFAASFKLDTYCWLNGIRDYNVPGAKPSNQKSRWLWQWNDVEQPVRIMGSKDAEMLPAGIILGNFKNGSREIGCVLKAKRYPACCMMVEGMPRTTITTIVATTPRSTAFQAPLPNPESPKSDSAPSSVMTTTSVATTAGTGPQEQTSTSESNAPAKSADIAPASVLQLLGPLLSGENRPKTINISTSSSFSITLE